MTDEEVAPLSVTVTRDTEGRFIKGVSGNPNGRPLADPDKLGTHALTQLKNKLDYAVRENISVDRVRRIVNKMCELAEEGNVRAAKLILDKVVSNAGGVQAEEQGDPTRTVVFQIQNATFAAAKATAQQGEIVDADVRVVEPVSEVPTESEGKG